LLVSKVQQGVKDLQALQVFKAQPEPKDQLGPKGLKDFLCRLDHEVPQDLTVAMQLKALQDPLDFLEPPDSQEKHHRSAPQVQLVPKEELVQQEDPDLMVLLAPPDLQDSRAF